MKKLSVILLFVSMVTSANAQFYVGGTLGVACQDTKISGIGNNSSTAYAIAPEFGYQFNDILAIGLSLGIGYDSSVDATMFDISPYLRATFAQTKVVDFFAEAVFEYGFVKNGYSDYNSAWGIGIRPGLLFKVSKKVHLVGRTVLFSYACVDAVKQTKFSLSSDFDFGVIFNL